MDTQNREDIDRTKGKEVMTGNLLPQIIMGRLIPHLVYVAAKLGIADLLADGPKRSDELARLVDAHPRTLYRVMRALTDSGIFIETEDGCFDLTPSAESLRSEVPGSVRSWAIMIGEDWFNQPFTRLLYSVKTGKDAFSHVHGQSLFRYLQQNNSASQLFNEVMTRLTNPVTDAVLAAYDFSGIPHIVDIGGGKGTLISAILTAYPRMHGTLFDLPQVIHEAGEFLEAEGLIDRCSLIPGDMFENVPEGRTYILKRVIHDWDDEKSLAILKNCRRSIARDGKLLLIEGVIPPGNQPSKMKLDDIAMLVILGGVERTRNEFSTLLSASGFKLVDVVPTQTSMCIIEAVPI